MLQFQAFGSLDLQEDGRSLNAAVTQAKRAALLAYLVLARPGQLHRRDTLLALFWPDLDQRHGRRALSQSLTYLRRELPEGVLATRGLEEVGVAANQMRCDVADFEAAVLGKRWAEALALYRGSLLEGLHVAGAPAFMDWLDRERERLRELGAAAAWRCAHEHIVAGELTEAERTAHRALRLVPTDESPARAFIEALARAGDRAAALRFYEKFTRVLAEELEVEPAPETVAVAEAVRNGDSGPPVNVQARGMARGEGRPEPPVRSARATTPAPAVAIEPTSERASASFEADRGGPLRRLRLWRAVTAFLLVGAGLVGYLIIRQNRTGGPGTLIGQGVVDRYDRVLVADLAAPFEPSLGGIASEWLRVELEQSDIVRPVDPAAVGAALERMQRDPSLPLDERTAREIALRDGYPLVVVGEMDQVGHGYLLTARLEAGANGAVLGRFRASASSDAEVVHALDRIGGEIRARIGESLRSVRRSPPLEQVTTSSLEALRFYTEAVRAREWEGREPEAVPLLVQATAADSTFAMAYRKLWIILNNRGERGQAEAASKAYEYRDRLSDYERLRVDEAHGFSMLPAGANDCDMVRPALRLYEAYIRRHPDDTRALTQYGYYLTVLGRLDEALKTFSRVVAAGTATPETYYNLINDDLRAGDEAAARAALALLRDRFGETPGTRGVLALLAIRAGHYSRADSLYAVWSKRFDGGADAELWQGLIDALRGRMREASDHYRKAEERYQRGGLAAGAVFVAFTEDFARLVAVGDTTAATRDLVRLIADKGSVFSLRSWENAGFMFALAGDVPRAQEAFDTLTAHGLGNRSFVKGALGGAIAIAAGAPERAIELLDEADIGCVFGVDFMALAFVRGRAYEALGQPDSAVAAYERWLVPPHVESAIPWEVVARFDVLKRVGRLYEIRGDSAQAAIYYARAADLWNDADPELQPRVRRLRERAAALVGRDRTSTSPSGADAGESPGIRPG